MTKTLIEEGQQAGIEQGIQQGIQQGAKQMKATGMPVQDIARFTGLGVKEIEALLG